MTSWVLTVREGRKEEHLILLASLGNTEFTARALAARRGATVERWPKEGSDE